MTTDGMSLMPSKLEAAITLQLKFKESVTSTRQLIKELEEKLDQVEHDTEQNLADEIRTLNLHESETNNGRQHENSSTKNVDGLKLPGIQTMFTTIHNQLKQTITDCKVEFGKKKIEDLMKQHTISVLVDYISGITMDIQRHEIVARTTDMNGPLKTFDYTGRLRESLGAGITGLANAHSYRSICMDTKRGFYMAPCSNTLLLVNRAGQQVKAITVGGDNSGSAYHKDDDCYLISEASNHGIYLIDAKTYTVTRQFGSHGSGPSEFSRPFNLHVGYVAGIGGSCILVSDCSNHCIKCFDMSGKHIQTYGSQGSDEGQLINPWGVTTDGRGRVIVCDRENKRLVSFDWECLLTNDWGGYQPWHLALDPDYMIMAIVDLTFKRIHLYS